MAKVNVSNANNFVRKEQATLKRNNVDIAEMLRAYESCRKQVSISEFGGSSDSLGLKPNPKDSRSESPYKKTASRELREFLTRGLDRAEKLIMILYYYEELTMKEIGQVIGISESRVSQTHKTIIERLRDRLKKKEHIFA